MAKYVLKFSKEGFCKYTSHLDLLRLFKRSFKRIGVKLQYSQGFNPHPKMGFAQPLSLGYSSIGEILEFETAIPVDAADIKEKLRAIMPEGLDILECVDYTKESKTLAALTEAAEYRIKIPVGKENLSAEQLCNEFLAQEHIVAKKKQKKTKELMEVDIKNKIRELKFTGQNEGFLVSVTLDAGSESNASPELLIEAILQFLRLDISRDSIEVTRHKLIFNNGFTI
ncbi:TIGR03936 family radical SAM-associated protein [Clostridium aminobutyricum]|uniref:DUF2344 domain-containing protein n=1 Tax=Clostridium aminobutyricum TaxID=33953 RepID=A0A939D6Y0_CLOAM|nr:TIGR03936 family radical SAM-associated protein [Clostridium aminobutyricum]MBN7772549.1 DUF2344 domain-containing protein [Clostridium aminobutyricum]